MQKLWMAKTFASTCIGLAVLGISASSQTLKKLTILSHFTATTGSGNAGVSGYVAPDGTEYAILTTMNTTGGVSIISLKDPKNPKEVAHVNSPDGIWHELVVYRNFIYKCADQGSAGLQIIDLAGLPASVKELTPYKPSNLTKCHSVWVDSTHIPALLYIQTITPSNAAIMASLADPGKPVEVGRIVVETHDGNARGNRAYISTGRTQTWDTYDITEVAKPVRIARVNLKDIDATLGEPGGSTYSHNIALSDDKKLAFTTEEVGGCSVKSWDITDEKTPKYLGKYLAGAPTGEAHNAYTRGKYLYLSHYGQGIRVVDFSDPKNMVEVAFHKPASGSTWGMYPSLPSGLLLQGTFGGASGLYVLDPDADIKLVGSTSIKSGYTQKNLFITPKNGGVRYYLPQAGIYTLSLHSFNGREVYSLRTQGEMGWQNRSFEGLTYPGTYLFSLRQEKNTSSIKMVLVK